MKYYLKNWLLSSFIIVAILGTSLVTFANNDDTIFITVEQQAEFPGGQGALMKWLSSNMCYPESAQQNEIEGRVIVRFVIEKDGSIGETKILKSVEKDIDREAIRLIKSMPHWKPGKINGIPVRSYFNLPVIFRLKNTNN